MKKTMVQIVCLGICVLFLCACAAPVSTINPSQHTLVEERILTDVRTQYRDASLILSGVSQGSHLDAEDEECFDILVSNVYAGNASPGDIVHCASQTMQEGKSYLLFLSEGEDVHYSEDMTGYELLSNAPMPIQDSEVIWDGNRLSLQTLQDELAELQSFINVPPTDYYYDTLQALAEAADEIFIGYVRSLGSIQPYEFVSRSNGSVQKTQYDASIAQIETYGVMKGIYSYGQTIELVYNPGRVSGMLDAKTLQVAGIDFSSTLPLEEKGIYLFFLIKGPDSKQEYVFPINPIQGFIKLSGEDITPYGGNLPLLQYEKLTPLIIALQDALSSANTQDETPILIIE